jgi:hypothetical protein
MAISIDTEKTFDKMKMHLGFFLKKDSGARHWWITIVILSTQEAEIWRISTRSHQVKGQWDSLSQKYSTQTNKHKGLWSGSSGRALSYQAMRP